MTMPQEYSDPVAKLLTYGAHDIKHMGQRWPDYLELGFTKEHIPDLIRMLTDPDLNGANPDDVKVWGPLHAWRSLGQLGADEAAEPLASLFDELGDDDWLSSELPKVFAMIGPTTIPALASALENDGIKNRNHIAILECFDEIAQQHPDCREDCVGVLTRVLEKFAKNDPALNGFLILGLVDLGALEAIDLIRRAYTMECVDLSILGDIEDVEIEMGIRDRRATPPPRINHLTGLPQVGTLRHVKVGRNDPCPCGSGKKFKKCCLH